MVLVWVSAVDWSTIEDYQNTLKYFINIITAGMDLIMPETSVKPHANDAPWMTEKLKSMIQQRQKAVPKQYYPFKTVPQPSQQRTEINQVEVLSTQNKTSQWKNKTSQWKKKKVVVRMQTPLRHDKNFKRYC